MANDDEATRKFVRRRFFLMTQPIYSEDRKRSLRHTSVEETHLYDFIFYVKRALLSKACECVELFNFFKDNKKWHSFFKSLKYTVIFIVESSQWEYKIFLFKCECTLASNM